MLLWVFNGRKRGTCHCVPNRSTRFLSHSQALLSTWALAVAWYRLPVADILWSANEHERGPLFGKANSFFLRSPGVRRASTRHRISSSPL